MSRIVRMKSTHGHEAFRLKVWKKTAFVKGWHANLKIGNREWTLYPSDRSRARQIEEGRRRDA